MSESEKKEQTQSDQPNNSEKDEFLEALKKDGDKGLREAFDSLNKDGKDRARVEGNHLERAISSRDPKITVENIKEIIEHVNREGLLSCDEFVKTVNVILTVKKDDEDVFKKAFDVMSKDGTKVHFEDVQLVILIRDPKISVANIKEIIQHVNREGFLTCEEFVKIVNLILTVRKDDGDVFKKAFDVMSKDGTSVGFKDVQLVILIRDPKISVENIKEIIQHVNREGLLSCDEFVKIVNLILIVKKDDEDVFKKAFDVLSKDGTPVRFKDVQLVILIRDPKISVENIKEIIQHVNREGSLSCDEFVKIVNLILIVKKDDEDVFKKAFDVLSKDGTIHFNDVQLVILIRDPKISVKNIKEIVEHVNREGFLTCDEFVKIVNLILTVKKDDEDVFKRAFDVMSKDGTQVRFEDVQLMILIRDPEISVENVKEIIQHVNREGFLTCDEFVKMINLILTVKKNDGDVFKKAFDVLSKDGTSVRFEDVQLTMFIRDPKIFVENIKEIIQHVNQEGLLSCDEFVKIVNLILTVKKDDGNVFKKAFDIMSKDGTPIHFKDVQLTILIRNPKLSEGKGVEILEQANKGDFNSEEFVEIFKLLEEPDGEEAEAVRTMEIYKKLQNAEARHEIILTGEKGVGKTWTAREVATRAVRKGDFDAAIWVYLNRNYAQDLSLQKSIAYQLSVLSDFEEFVANKAKKKAEEEEAKKNESPDGRGDEKPPKKEDTEVKNRKEELENLIENLIKKALKGKRVLFVHDGDGENTMKAEIKIEMRKKHEQKEKQKRGDEEKKEEGSDESKKKDEGKNEEGGEMGSADEVEKKIDTKKMEEEEEEIYFMELKRGEVIVVRLELGSLASHKVLTTTSRKQGEVGKNEITVKPFSWNNSTSFATKALQGEKFKELVELAHYFVFRSQRLPSQLLLIRRIVAYFGGKKDFGLQKLKSHREMIKKGQGSKMFNVLIQGYEEMLPKSVLIDCYSPERDAPRVRGDAPDGHFMYQKRPVSFNELICYWIMEGHFGHSDQIDKMYMKGHQVLMELMNCGLLQKQEGDYVVPTGTTEFDLRIHDYKDFFSEPRPGLGVTFDMSLGRVALGDGRIVTIGRKSDDGKEQLISTLLLDGDRISEEERTTETLSKYKDRVEVLAISNPTSQHFKLPILEMKELRLLALRGCQFLDKLEDFLSKKPDQVTTDKSVHVKQPDPSPQEPAPPRISEPLEKLTVLEISGPCEAKTIPDFFSLMPNLKTVNLSHLNNVESLPPSFYDLKYIKFLILRGCSRLKELSTLKNFTELKVLDVSDAESFEKFEDKSLHINAELQILNLSNTKLKTLPLINKLKKLKFVWLRDCQVLPRIRKIDQMECLKIFDIAGARDVERFCDPSLEDLSSLLIVDISGTKIRRLPANIGDPTYLYAKDCLKLRVVPPVEGLTKLEVLDLSGCTRLKELRKEFFDKLKDVITELNLSNTRVESLPFLSSLTSLRRLQLSECKFLRKVENLSCLEKLETLDLSGCEMVMDFEGSFDKMINLKILNLSRTGIKALPSLSKLQSLEELYVRDCLNLNMLPGVEEALNLKVLDYYGTVLQSPPSFKERAHLKVIGEGIESIDPTKLFEALGFQNNDGDKPCECKEEYVNGCKWIISNSKVENEEEKLGTPVYGAHFLQLLEMRPSFLTDDLSKFSFLVYPSEAEDKIKARFPGNYSYNVEVSMREIYMGQVCEEKMKKSLELREFNELPKTLHSLLDEAEFIVLVDDKFLNSLLDLRVEGTMPEKMKACWIERCNKLEYVVAAPEEVKKPEEEAKSEEEQKKEAAMVKGEGDKGKKNSAVEKAGESTTSEGDKPKDGEAEKGGGGEEQKNAGGDQETKNEGDESKNGGAADTSGGSGKVEDDQQKGAAAEEKTAETAMNEGGEKKEEKTEEHPKNESDLPKDAAPKIEGNQEKNTNTTDSAKNEGDQPKNDNEGEAAKIKGNEEKNAAEYLKNNLQRLWISDVSMMQSICKGDVQSVSFNFLKSLYLEFCPNLSAICASSSQLPNLETLIIKYCQKLRSLFEFEDQNPSKMENLQHLELWGLDSLQEINCDAPSLIKLRVGECPNLKHLISSRLTAPQQETEGHQNLKFLHIKSCDKLKGIFEQEGVVFENLTELELSGLPEMKNVAMEARCLSTLRVEDCPSLECVITGAAGDQLQILDMRSCEKMTTIIGGGGSRLVEAMEIKLLGLPELKFVGPELPEGQEEIIRAWPKLKTICACPKLKTKWACPK